jgi:hypothetical protein
MLQGQAFDPDHCQAMGLAFEELLQELGLKDRNDPLCAIIATKIIELGQRGVREPTQLHELAMQEIKG